MKDYIKFKPIVYNIIGSSMEVHKVLGHGLLENVYEEALSIELSNNGIVNETQKEIRVFYKGVELKKKYKMDLVCGDIVCELKSVSNIVPAHRAQLCNYLRLTRKPIGLLLNFGKRSLEGERWAFDPATNDCYLIDVNMNPVDMVGISIEGDSDDSD